MANRGPGGRKRAHAALIPPLRTLLKPSVANAHSTGCTTLEWKHGQVIPLASNSEHETAVSRQLGLVVVSWCTRAHHLVRVFVDPRARGTAYNRLRVNLALARTSAAAVYGATLATVQLRPRSRQPPASHGGSLLQLTGAARLSLELLKALYSCGARGGTPTTHCPGR